MKQIIKISIFASCIFFSALHLSCNKTKKNQKKIDGKYLLTFNGTNNFMETQNVILKVIDENRMSICIDLEASGCGYTDTLVYADNKIYGSFICDSIIGYFQKENSSFFGVFLNINSERISPGIYSNIPTIGTFEIIKR
jgi:hypothetical protein